MHVGTIPSASSLVRIGAGAARAIRSATVAAGPQEACGLLLGDTGLITDATRARNVATDPARRFEIDPAHLFETHRRARAGGPAILGCWHSHPNGRPGPSRQDAEGALIPGWLWLIALPGGGFTLWRRSADGFVPVACVETPA